MNNIKLIIFLVIALSFTSISKANAVKNEDWVDVCGWKNPCSDKTLDTLQFDKKSVNFRNDSIYYTIRYYSPNTQPRVVVVQYKHGKAGIVQSYSSDSYREQEWFEYSKRPSYTLNKEAPLKEIREGSIISDTVKLALKVANDEQQCWKPYMEEVQNKIKSNWKPPAKMSHAVVEFTINRNGQLGNMTMRTASPMDVANAARNAIRVSAPFSKFPYWATQNDVNIQMDFTKN